MGTTLVIPCICARSLAYSSDPSNSSDNSDHDHANVQKRQLYYTCQQCLGRCSSRDSTLSPTPIMARKFFVGGNFKMNPTTESGLESLVNHLNHADLDPNTGLSSHRWQISPHEPLQRSSLRPLPYICHFPRNLRAKISRCQHRIAISRIQVLSPARSGMWFIATPDHHTTDTDLQSKTAG